MVRRTQKAGEGSFERRSRIAAAFFLLCFGVIVGRLYQLQVVRGDVYRKTAQEQHGILKKILPARGEIKIFDKLSNESLPLAVNIDKPLVYADPAMVENPRLASESLASLLGMEASEVLEKVTRTQRRYVPIKKSLTEEEQKKISDLKLPGIYFDQEKVRYYPEKSLLAQTVGFVGYKGADSEVKQGLYGLERNFEKSLAGKEGLLKEEKDLSGAWIFGSNRQTVPAVDGVNLLLTIDKSLQYKAESVLKAAVEQNEADSGSMIVIDPKTGAVLAMAGFPAFDPNEFSKVEDAGVYQNLNVTGSYEPGSIFKPLTMAAAINEGKIGPDSVYTDAGEVKIDEYTIKNSDLKANGQQTMVQVLEKSLNTGVIYAKEQIGNKKFLEYIKKFGFGEYTGIELPESKGNLENLKGNIGVNYHTASFGQGILITPIQMVQAFTALANQGKMVHPHLVQSVIHPDGKTETIETKEAGQIISAKTANTVSAMLVSVVENGHGKKAGVPGYYIAGKTGTAQVAKKNGRGYEENNNIGSFIGYGPVENPVFLALVRINHPRTVNFAETTAAPAFGEMAKFIMNYYHIAPTRNDQ